LERCSGGTDSTRRRVVQPFSHVPSTSASQVRSRRSTRHRKKTPAVHRAAAGGRRTRTAPAPSPGTALQVVQQPLPFSAAQRCQARGNPDTSIAEPPVSVDRLEWEHLQRVLMEYGGNISAAARAPGMHRRAAYAEPFTRSSSRSVGGRLFACGLVLVPRLICPAVLSPRARGPG